MPKSTKTRNKNAKEMIRVSRRTKDIAKRCKELLEAGSLDATIRELCMKFLVERGESFLWEKRWEKL